MDAYFSSNRKDLDGAFKLVLDMLQSSNTIKNDRNCVKIVANKFIDHIRPRLEFTIVEVGGIEEKNSKQPNLFDKA
jgi:Holliday junction resolvase RusA-like endonuclease